MRSGALFLCALDGCAKELCSRAYDVNPRVLSIQSSLIRKVAARKKPMSIDLGLGEPSLMPMAAHFEAAMTYVRDHGIRYTANAGDPELRNAIAEHYAYPRMKRAENVCVTIGSQEAMFATFLTLLDPNCDELLVVEPTFPSYAKMAALNGIPLRRVSMAEEEDFAVDAERISAAIGDRTRAIVLCSPNNPTARAIAPDQAEILVSALEQRGSDVTLIHDEIYREQRFAPSADLANLYANTIAINSLSKSNALTGLRLGWMIGNAKFIEQAVKAHAWIASCTDTFAQRVALHVFKSGAIREHAAWYEERQREVAHALRESGLRFIVPEGAFYACVRLPGGARSLDTALKLAEERNVIAIPGIAFGDSLEGWLRLSWVAPIDEFREGLHRIASLCATLEESATADSLQKQ
jgi:aminotransferase